MYELNIITLVYIVLYKINLFLELYDGEIKLNIVKDGYDLEYTLAFVHCTFPKSKYTNIYLVHRIIGSFPRISK